MIREIWPQVTGKTLQSHRARRLGLQFALTSGTRWKDPKFPPRFHPFIHPRRHFSSMDIYDSKSRGSHSPFPRTPIPPAPRNCYLRVPSRWGGGSQGPWEPLAACWLPASRGKVSTHRSHESLKSLDSRTRGTSA